MKNTPYNVVDPETGKEKVVWESRSVAAAMFVFARDTHAGKWYVLANKRGTGCPDYQGYWCCPCGYVDYGETTKEAAIRECAEETGVSVYKFNAHFYSFSDDPSDNRENITFIYYAEMPVSMADVRFNTINSEENEVAEVKWIPVDDVFKYDWAFNHNNIIQEIYTHRINIPAWMHELLSSYKAYLSPINLQ